MSELHIHRIKSFLLREYASLIDVSDIDARIAEDTTNYILTRSQAALALSHTADLPAEDAAKTIVDGFDDNGVDAVFYDEDASILYLVQSKWVASGSKAMDLGSVEKFVSGVRDLLAAKFDRFNHKVQKRRGELEAALESHDVSIALILAYTGTQPLSVHAERVLGDLMEEINDPTDILSRRVYSQKELYSAISGGLEGAPINLDVTIHEWGRVAEPFRAYYGRVSASEIAGWYDEYDSRLFARNLRRFKGDTEVNRQIKATLTRDPEKFWYFNNGITVLANRIKKKPLGGSNRDIGHLYCEGVSVVNGAQTVGNIAASVKQGFARAEHAYVLVRFISLEDCPPDFATEVTTATNTQNRIEPRDFASLDPMQERLRQEILLDVEKTYVYKSGDKDPLPQDGCTIEEATIALACANPNIQLAAQAKSAVGKLWEDIKKPPYTLIFNEQLTAARIWNTIEVLRQVDNVLGRQKNSHDGVRKRVAIHGNRFILHRVLQALPLHEFDQPDLQLDMVKRQAVEETEKVLEETVDAINKHFEDAYLNSLFKSGQKCVELSQHLPPLPKVESVPYFEAPIQIRQGRLFTDVE